jgi:TolB-like protein/Tfp pilus assembly protein PilF
MPGRTASTAAPRITSLAVLPLENLSGDPAQEFFADGMTEALISELAHIRALKVVSRTSVMTFKGTKQPLPEIARALGVDAVLQGSVQRLGDRVRIGAQLIDGETDAHLWARDYERGFDEIPKLQAEVARAVSEEIRVRVTAQERALMAAASDSVHPAAYQEYLIGRHHLWRENEENLKHAVAHFERATEIDPTYAAAFAGLAHAWWERGMFGPMGLEAAEPLSRAAARRALELDDRHAEAWVVQADLKRIYDRDLTGAEDMIARALVLEPNSVHAHYTYAMLLMALGRFPEAIAHMEIADRLDPLSPTIQSNFGRVLYRARRFDEAVPRLNRALELEPEMSGSVNSRLADVYEQMGQYDRALAASLKAGTQGRGQLARTYARLGKYHEARQILEDAKGSPRRLSPLIEAGAYAALGDKDQAFRVLFESLTAASPPLFISVDPPLDSLHSDPRWAELVERVRRPKRDGLSRSLPSPRLATESIPSSVW